MTWRELKLSDVAIVGPRDPALPEDAPFVPMASVEVGRRYPVSYDRRGSRGGIRARANDVLFARITPCLENGKIAQLPAEAVPTGGSTEFLVVRPGQEIDPGFLYYWCSSPEVRDRAEREMTGTTGRMRFAGKDLAQFPIHLPPIDQQHRIVAILEDHLSGLDAADTSLESAGRRLQALREQMVLRAVTGESWGMRGPKELASVGTADGALPDLPDGWEWARLGDVAEVVGGVTKDSKRQADPAYVAVPYLRVANVQRGYLDLDSVTTIRVPVAKAEALRLERGDVLLNEGGDRDKLARGWVWSNEIEGCIHQNHVFRARLTESRLTPEFLSFTANSLGGPWAERNGKQSVNLASISLRVIRHMPVVVPAPGLAEQVVSRLEDELTVIDRMVSAIEAARSRSAILRRALLSAAFSGRLNGVGSDA